MQRPPPPAENLRSPAERLAAAAVSQESGHAISPANTGNFRIGTRSEESGHAESGHGQVGLDGSNDEDSEEDPWATRRRALQGHLERARVFHERIALGLVVNAAALAAEERLTRARVCQLLKLLHLAPEVLADLEDGVGPVPSEHQLRKLANVQSDEDQVKQYRELVEAEAANRKHSIEGPKPPPVRRGFQHLFRRARHYHSMLESGEAPSMEAIARAEGISSTRVRQVLMLLQLPLEVIEQLDVPPELLTAKVSEKALRSIASSRRRSVQLLRWRRLSSAEPPFTVRFV